MPAATTLLVRTWQVLRDAARGFGAHRGPLLAAAMAFHVTLAIAPLLLLTLWLASLIDPSLQPELLDRLQVLLGEDGARTVTDIIRDARADPDAHSLVGWVLLASLILTVTSAFAQLQSAMNAIWGVSPRPMRRPVLFLKKRLVSLALIGLFGLVLVLSVFLDAVLSFLASEIGAVLHVRISAWNIVEPIASLIAIFLLFCAFLRLLPDVHLRWGQVATGAGITTLLFALGKGLIAWYLGTRALDSVYGAAGSFIAVLLWVYYSSIIFVFGVELTRAGVRLSGERPLVERFAEQSPMRDDARNPDDDAPAGGADALHSGHPQP